MGLCPIPRPPAFLSEKSGAKELNFSCFTLSFRAGVYGTKMGMDLRKIYLPFSIACPRKLERLIAAKRGKNNVLPQSVPLTPFARHFAAFFFFIRYGFYFRLIA